MKTWQEALILIPEHMHSGITSYLEHGVSGGSFQFAVFSNDLLGACLRADETNKRRLFNYGEFLQYCPHGSYGSKSAVVAWEKSGGLAGRAKKETENAQD